MKDQHHANAAAHQQAAEAEPLEGLRCRASSCRYNLSKRCYLAEPTCGDPPVINEDGVCENFLVLKRRCTS